MQESDTPNFLRPDDSIPSFPIYSYVIGLFYYRIERNYRDGRKETVAKIPKSITGASKIAFELTKILINRNTEFPSDEFCAKHIWIKTAIGRVCENCGVWENHFR